ncbi:MAG: hypothetical protein ACF8QF_14110 [Phycisphaerales bacterium]
MDRNRRKKEAAMALAPDDLTPGMFITVLETTVERPAPGPGGHPSMIETKEYAGAGVVLEVVATSFPFVLVRNHTIEIMRSPKVFPLDLRRTKVMRLTEEYVRAAIDIQPGRQASPALPAPPNASMIDGPTPMPFTWGANQRPENDEDR